MKRLSFLLTLIISTHLLAAFGQPSPLYFKNYQVLDGLSSNTITSVVQDKKGFMWFGTRNGLNRFDGTHFKTYTTQLNDRLSLGSNSILSLYEDKYEQLWVGTYQGIYVYHPLNESFTLIKDIPKGEVRFITGDNDQIWLIVDAVLYRYDVRSRRTVRYNLAQVTSLHRSKQGTLWVGNNTGQIKRYVPKENRFITYSTGSGPINTLHSVGDSILLIGAIRQSFSYNLTQRNLHPIFTDRYTTDVQTHSIYQVDPFTYWFGTENGIFLYNLKSGNAVLVDKQPSQLHTLTNNTISSIYQDTEGGIWIGTYFGGLNYYSKQYNNFKKYYPQQNQNSISGDVIHEICKDKYGNLWIGTEDAGLNCYDKKSGKFTHYLPSGNDHSLSYSNIHGLLAYDNELWIGTYEHGLDVMDLRSRKIIRRYNTSMANNFGSNFIVCLYKTGKNEILIGTWSGLYRYNRKQDNFEQLPYFQGHIQSIMEDTNGTLWVATYGRGVYYENETTGLRGQFLHHEKKNSIINDYVNHVYQDYRGNFWFCTESGLSRLDFKKKHFEHFTTARGLSDNQIFRIVEDKKGAYWVSTANGLNKLDLLQQNIEQYHTAHGLPTEQFNYNSSFQDHDGTLYFGTVRGMVSFRPDHFFVNQFIPPLFITGIEINNRSLQLRQKDQILQKSVLYVDSLSLPYDKANINFDIAALSFSIPEKNRYQYRMDGIDKEWISLEDNRKIYYTKLAPGDYIFRLKAANSDGIWNKKERQLFLHILPPFWATHLAYICYVLLIAGIVFTIFRYYTLALKAKEKERMQSFEMSKEREVHHAKIDFFTNIAHEIRTPLTLIKMPLDKLLKTLQRDKSAQEYLIMIEKNTDRLIDLTNQLLDFRKAEANNFSLNFTKADINELLQQEFNQFKAIAEGKGLSFQLKLPRITLHAFVDTQALKKIISNLLSNAVKYAQSHVYINLLPFSSEDLFFHVEFKNDGYLIQGVEKEKIFEPFYRIKGSDKEPGTGIGLPLARSLAELHKGTLEVHANEDRQNVFLLSIPIHQDYELEILKEYQPAHKNIDPEKDIQENSISPVILLVEDNIEILHYLAKELATAYRVIKSKNGQEALNVLDRELVHLIISDIMMPLMDGISFTRIVKTDLRFSHIPLILLTAKNSVQSKIEGLEKGADAYIEKPFSYDYLSAQISNLLASRNQLKTYFARSPLTHIKGIGYSKTDKDFLEHLNSIIYEHITDINLDVDNLSALMNMSRPTLYRKIKGISDLTPNELINLTRLKRAAELLAEGRYKINEVAYMIGYSVPTNFSRDFQRQFGMSPSTYLSQLKDT